MPDRPATDQDPMDAYWDALVRGEPPRLDVDPASAQLIAHLQAIYPPSSPDPSFRARLREDLLMTAAMAANTASSIVPSDVVRPFSLNGTGPVALPAPAAPREQSRGRLSAFAILTVLILALAALSLPFVGSRLGRPAEPLVIIPAMTQSDLATPAAVQEITGGDDPLTAPSGIAVGDDGTLYVIDVPRDHIRVFNADGTPKATWGTSGDGPGEFGFSFDFPWGALAIAPDGNLYVLDPNLARIQVFSPDGTFLFGFAERGSEEGQILFPLGIGVGPDGHVYVADWGNHRVAVFDGEGSPLASWDGTANEGTPLGAPTDIAVTPDGTVWVADEVLQKIIGFAPDGTIVSTIGKIGDEPGELRGPWGLVADPAGNLFVAEFENERVQRFAPDGAPLGTIGVTGDQPGQLTAPRNLAVGPDGSLYVTEEGSTSILRFPPDAPVPPNILVTTEHDAG